MQLYYSPGSPYARVARIVLQELRVPCELVVEREFPPRLVEAVNPAMQVPALVDGSHSLFGTRLIVEYLMKQYPRSGASDAPAFAEQPTRPSEHWHDAQVLTALETFLQAAVARNYLIWTGVEHRSSAAIPLDLAERELARMYRLLDWLERQATPDGFIPEMLSLQDIWLISAIAWTEARIPIAWRGRLRLESILERHADRTSIQTTAPNEWPPRRKSSA